MLSPTFCRTIDVPAETSASSFLLSVLLLIQDSRILRYRYTSHKQCVVCGSEMRELSIFKTISSHGTPLMVFGVGTRNLLNSKKFQISYEKVSQNKKKHWIFVYLLSMLYLYYILCLSLSNFISIFFVSIIAETIIKAEKTITIT